MAKQSDFVFAEVRQQELLSLINKKGRIAVNDLCKKFGVSPVTIRKDLTELERLGHIKRVHGGAISIRESSSIELTSQEKTGLHTTQKRTIAQIARRYLEPGLVIALDSGTTTLELAKMLVDAPEMTIITNDLKIALFLEENTSHTLIFLGGIVRKNFHCTAGNISLDILDSLHVDMFFLAANAIDLEWGLSTPNVEMANVKRKLVKNSKRTVLLSDSSKFGKVSMTRFATIDQIHTLITDKHADPAFLSAVEAMGIEVCTG